MSIINANGDDWRVELPVEDAVEIAMVLRQAIAQHPDCEFQVNFTDENGTLKWAVKACQVRSAEAPVTHEE